VKIIFNDHIFSWQKYGGISRYFYELASHLSFDPGLKVKVISPFYVNEYLSSASKDLFVGTKMPTGHFLEKGYRFANRLLAPLYFRPFKPDIFHETYYSTWGTDTVRAKRVLTVYDMIHEKLPEYFDIRDKTSKRKAAAILRADHVICISEKTRTDLVELLGVPYKKTSVVHLGFSFHDSDLTIPKLDTTSPFLLYVGERRGYKNFLSLLDVYANHPFLCKNFRLVAFGGGCFSNLELQKISSLKLDLSIVQQVTGDDGVLKSLYKTASLFIYPSQYEGFGIPPLEAMSMGCPVACSNTGALPEVVGDVVSFFDPTSKESMANAILHCLENQAYRDALIQKGQMRVKNYSWQKCARETKAIYEEILS
jgi:glycosyltransferase involved in cell wall biosynthesis